MGRFIKTASGKAGETTECTFGTPVPHTDKPALVVELKYNKSADTAIKQIKDRHYTQALEGYSGELLLVGINYDKENENKPHRCVIEKQMYNKNPQE